MAEDNNVYFSFGSAVEQPLKMRFSDGEHFIPGFMVVQAGGADALTENASSLAQITFAEFARAASDEKAAEYMRRAQNFLINESLRGWR